MYSYFLNLNHRHINVRLVYVCDSGLVSAYMCLQQGSMRGEMAFDVSDQIAYLACLNSDQWAMHK